MTGDNKWKDDNGIARDAEKKIDIWDFPDTYDAIFYDHSSSTWYS